MAVTVGNITIAGDGTATWTGAAPSFIGTQPVFYPPVAPDAPVTSEERPDVIKHQFGDGYIRRAPRGLNHVQMQLSLTWSNLYAADKDLLVQFFRARKGVEPFWYTQPNEACRRFVCEAWGTEQQGWDRWRVSARFVRDWSSPF